MPSRSSRTSRRLPNPGSGALALAGTGGPACPSALLSMAESGAAAPACGLPGWVGVVIGQSPPMSSTLGQPPVTASVPHGAWFFAPEVVSRAVGLRRVVNFITLVLLLRARLG